MTTGLNVNQRSVKSSARSCSNELRLVACKACERSDSDE